MSAHDRWLANYRSYPTDVYCVNPKCPYYGEPLEVEYMEELGQGWTEPEECPSCYGDWSFDAPPELEDEEVV